MSKTATEEPAPKSPNGRPADERLIHAITSLCDQFAVCGLDQPLAIVVKTGQAKWIQAMVMKSEFMLVEDKRSTELRIWGVPIREDQSSHQRWNDITKHPSPTVAPAMFWLDWADDVAPLNSPMPESDRLFVGKNRCWSSLYKATHWRDLPFSPYLEGLS